MLIFKNNIESCKFTIADTHIKSIRPKEGVVLSLTNLDGKIVTIKVKDYDYKTGNGSYDITKTVLVPKPIDKVLIQCIIDKHYLDKLLEIIPIVNITNLILVQSDYSNVPNINIERLELILTRACEQCENPYKPTINWIKKEKIINYLSSNTIKGVVLELPSKNTQPITHNTHNSDTVIVGPEGGFSEEESNFFVNNNYPYHSIECNVLPAWLAGYTYYSGI